MNSIAYKIEKLRESRGLSKTSFAKKIGMNRDTVYNLTDESIRVSTLRKISDTLGVPISHFLEEKEKTTQVREPEIIYGKKVDCDDLRRMNAFLTNQIENQQATINGLTHALENLTKNAPAILKKNHPSKP